MSKFSKSKIKAWASQKPCPYKVTLPGWPGWVGPVSLDLSWTLHATKTMSFFPGKLELGIQYNRQGLAGFLNGGDINLGAISNYFLLCTLGSYKSAVKWIKRKYENEKEKQ